MLWYPWLVNFGMYYHGSYRLFLLSQKSGYPCKLTSLGPLHPGLSTDVRINPGLTRYTSLCSESSAFSLSLCVNPLLLVRWPWGEETSVQCSALFSAPALFCPCSRASGELTRTASQLDVSVLPKVTCDVLAGILLCLIWLQENPTHLQNPLRSPLTATD